MKNIVVIIIVLMSVFNTERTTNAQVSVGVGITVAPPPIPVYDQPPCPVDGYLWTPGYWAWGPDGYYWVPGVWAAPLEIGFLWTPGYWGFYGGYYRWHRGYWGSHVGYYGGINYGFGYSGRGYWGGRWEGRHFRYNTAITHVGNSIHNTYVDKTVVHNNFKPGGASFHGGARATSHTVATHQSARQQVTHANANNAQRHSAPQQHMAQRSAPQQHMGQRSAPQQHFAMQQHGAPQHMSQQQRGGGGRAMGGGGGRPMGGGGNGGGHRR